MERVFPEERCGSVFGMGFDSCSVLWYALTARRHKEENIEYGVPAARFHWDIARGGKPEDMGVFGTPDFGSDERIGTIVIYEL